MARWLGVILLSVAACGDEPKSAPKPASPGSSASSGDAESEPALRPLPAAAVAKGDVAFFVRGAARLGLKVRGEGVLAVHVEQDPLTISTPRVEARGESSTLSIDLPGAGVRPIRVTWTLPAGVEVAAATVSEAGGAARPDDASAAHRFAGALAGRHVVVLLADALHADHLGCFGSPRPTSPRIDALAKEGVRFKNARAQSAWTIPSVTTLMTGLPQEQHGVRDVGVRLDDAVPTLAEAMRARGYATLALVQNTLVTKETGLARGFDEWSEFAGEARDGLVPAFQAAVGARRERPLFAYVHLLPPHAPYTPPAPFATQFERPVPGADGSIAVLARLNKPGATPADPAVLRMAGLYDNSVAYADALVGRIVDAAVAAFGKEKLAVVVLSDHGEAFGQHGLLGHNTQLFDEMVHVPLVVWAPGSPLSAGSTFDAPFCLTEFAATLRSFVGDTESAKGDTAPPLRFLSARFMKSGPLQRAVLFGTWKFVEPWGRDGAALFDLARDPGERADVGRDHPVLIAALKQELEAWVARSTQRAGATFTPDAKLQKELGELGYTQGGK
jgi:arylsulfatase A-like enzyme